MMVMGDELAKSHDGNNNWYGHDTPMAHMQWDGERDEAKAGLLRFMGELIAFRVACPLLGHSRGALCGGTRRRWQVRGDSVGFPADPAVNGAPHHAPGGLPTLAPCTGAETQQRAKRAVNSAAAVPEMPRPLAERPSGASGSRGPLTPWCWSSASGAAGSVLPWTQPTCAPRCRGC